MLRRLFAMLLLALAACGEQPVPPPKLAPPRVTAPLPKKPQPKPAPKPQPRPKPAPEPRPKPAPQPHPADELLARSKKLFEDDQVAQSEAAAAQAIALDPARVEGYLRRGLARARQIKLLPARADYDKAVTLAPKLARAWFERGNLRILQRDLAGASADFTRAIELDPRDKGAWANRGSVRALQRDLPGAIADYGQAIALDPRYLQGYVNRAAAHGQQGDLDRTSADLHAADDLARTLAGPAGEELRARIERMWSAVRRMRRAQLMKVDSTAALKPFLALKDTETRRAAYRLLVALARKGDGVLAAAGLTDPDRFVRTYAATALARIGLPAAVAPLLARLAGEPDEAVRGAIAIALVRLGRQEQLMQPLIDLLRRDPSPYVVEVAAGCLVRLTGVDPGVRLDLQALAASRKKLAAAWTAWWRARSPKQAR